MSTELNEKLDSIVNARDEIKTELQKKSSEILTDDIRTYASIINRLNSSTDLSNANVLPEDITLGKLAFGNNGLIIGTANTGNLVANVSNISYDLNTGEFNINYNGFNNSYHFYNNDLITLQTNQANIANAINLQPEKIITGETVLGVSGNGTTIPEGLYIQDSIPTKTTAEALWAKTVTPGKASTQISPDEGSGVWVANYDDDDYTWVGSVYWKWQDIYEKLTAEQIEQFDSYNSHLIINARNRIYSGSVIYVLAADSIIRLSDGVKTVGNAMIMTCSCTFDRTQGFSVEEKTEDYKIAYDTITKYYAFNTILNSDGSVAYESDITDTEDGICVTINGTRYVIYTNKVNSWDKILDTADATATDKDILQDKTAYVNNKKLTGTMLNMGDLSIIPNLNIQTSGAGYYNSITVNAASVMNKTINPSIDSQVVTPEEGYLGLSSVTINPVTGSIDGNIQPEYIKNGINILGIMGNYEGSGGGSGNYNAKLFATYELMQNDSTAQEGDFATVYGSTRVNINNEYLGSSIMLAKNVTVPEEYRNIDFWGYRWSGEDYIDGIYFSRDSMYNPPLMYLYKSNEFNYVWASEDGINYVCNNINSDTLISLNGTYANGDGMYQYNDIVSLFILYGGSSSFNGFYQYTDGSYSIVKDLSPLSSRDAMVDSKTTFYGSSGLFNLSPIANFENIPDEDVYMKLKILDKFYSNNFNFSTESKLDINIINDYSVGNLKRGNAPKIVFNNTVTNNAYGMFAGWRDMTLAPFVNLDNCQDASAMFSGCSSLTVIPYGLNTVNITNFAYMFSGCTSLYAGYSHKYGFESGMTIKDFDFSNAENLAGMFVNCNLLLNSGSAEHSIPNALYDFNMDFQYKDINVYCMFNLGSRECGLENVSISNINNASHMFYGFTFGGNINNLSIHDINNAHEMLYGSYYKIDNIEVYNIIQFDNAITHVNNLSNAYINNVGHANRLFCSNIWSSSITWDNVHISNVSVLNLVLFNMKQCNIDKISNVYLNDIGICDSMFAYCNNSNISNIEINFTNINSMNSIFYDYYNNVIDSITLNGSNVQFLNDAFSWSNAESVNNLNIYGFSNVNSLFNYCQKLEYVYNLNLYGCGNVSNIFANCSNITYVHISNMAGVYDFSMRGMSNSVTDIIIDDMSDFIGHNYSPFGTIFGPAKNIIINNLKSLENGYCFMGHSYYTLTDVTITGIENLTNASEMFAQSEVLQNINLSGNFDNVVNVNRMFYRCNNLSDSALNNIIDVLLNCKNATPKSLVPTNNLKIGSVFWGTNISNTRYQSRWAELRSAGWTY